eukprot:TRINITY_DN3520_c0_g1_i6.p3 TRINITY_DN3520_c0_g1~~TRINITY_DN3520_c0_g1_i6.p3  ORF type:complete len:156 (+),score=11.26 TRINITY_DN3520_c0_g1_i6:1278-1745(+)
MFRQQVNVDINSVNPSQNTHYNNFLKQGFLLGKQDQYTIVAIFCFVASSKQINQIRSSVENKKLHNISGLQDIMQDADISAQKRVSMLKYSNFKYFVIQFKLQIIVTVQDQNATERKIPGDQRGKKHLWRSPSNFTISRELLHLDQMLGSVFTTY